MKKLIGLEFIPLNPDLGILLFRIALSAMMIFFHGWHKLTGWEDELHTFPDLIGISSEVSYVLVAWLETFGTILIAMGLFTRIQSLGLAFTMFVAFFLWHDMMFTGSNSGQTAFTFAFAYLMLFLTGAGKYSLDHLFGIK